MNPDAYTLPAELEELVAQLPTLAAGEEPAPYPHDAEDEHDGQDDLDELGAGETVRTSREAIKLGRDWIRRRVYVGVGYCLKTIRSLFGVGALWPDAETAAENAARMHKMSDPTKIPWGVPVWWLNGRHGHIALSLGNGRCLTTDYVRTGELGVAQIGDLASWCGGRLAGWSNDLNGVTVWEPARPQAEADPWGLDDKIRFVRNALERAVANDAPERRIRGLRTWLDRLQKRAQS